MSAHVGRPARSGGFAASSGGSSQAGQTPPCPGQPPSTPSCPVRPSGGGVFNSAAFCSPNWPSRNLRPPNLKPRKIDGFSFFTKGLPVVTAQRPRGKRSPRHRRQRGRVRCRRSRDSGNAWQCRGSTRHCETPHGPGADGRGAYLGHFIRTLSGVPGREPLRRDPVRVAADAHRHGCVRSGTDVGGGGGSPSGRSWGGLWGEAEAESPFLRCSFLHC